MMIRYFISILFITFLKGNYVLVNLFSLLFDFNILDVVNTFLHLVRRIFAISLCIIGCFLRVVIYRDIFSLLTKLNKKIV